MKTNYYILLALVLLAMGCSKDEPAPVKEIPTPPTAPPLTVTCGQKVTFSELPTAAQNHITEFYPSFTVTEVEVCTDSNGNKYYEVDIEKGSEEYDVYFDGSGAFLAIKDDQGGVSTTPPNKAKIPPNTGNGGTPIDIRCDIDFSYDNLPPAVKSHVDTYYPNFKIDDVDVCKDGNGNIVAYEIELEQGESEYWLYFDTNGGFLIAFDKFGNNTTEPPKQGNITPPGGGTETVYYCGSEINKSEVPTKILDYLATNYPNHTLDDVEVCHDSQGILAYDAEMEGPFEIHVFFDKDGNFVGTSNDDFDGDDGPDNCDDCEGPDND